MCYVYFVMVPGLVSIAAMGGTKWLVVNKLPRKILYISFHFSVAPTLATIWEIKRA